MVEKIASFILFFLLVTCVLAILSNQSSKEAIQRFCKRHYAEICRCLKIPILEKAPSEKVFRSLFENIDLHKIQMAIDDDKVVHLDGKAIKGTVSNANTSEQNFLMVISAFSGRFKQMLAMRPFANKAR